MMKKTARVRTLGRYCPGRILGNRGKQRIQLAGKFAECVAAFIHVGGKKRLTAAC